jgi:acetyl-CoA carboxylase, biotin carboxyl carrier protein
MDIKQIKEIAAAMKENGLTAFEITEGDTCLRMERQPAPVTVQAAAPAAPVQAQSVKAETPAMENPDALEIKSPMVGVFYTKPSPEAEPYVSIGSRVKKGDTLCVIEAMKLLNEITAERDGEITGICAQDGQMVEYAQVLFQMV